MNLASRRLRPVRRLHSLTQLLHPDGNPEHLVGKGGRKQDPIVPPVLTWHELSKQVTWQDPPDRRLPPPDPPVNKQIK